MDEQLLIRFLTHTCTPEDLRSIDQWIASGKPNADWLFEMERIWSLKDELRFSDRREIEEAYNRFLLFPWERGKKCETAFLHISDIEICGSCYHHRIIRIESL